MLCPDFPGHYPELNLLTVTSHHLVHLRDRTFGRGPGSAVSSVWRDAARGHGLWHTLCDTTWARRAIHTRFEECMPRALGLGSPLQCVCEGKCSCSTLLPCCSRMVSTCPKISAASATLNPGGPSGWCSLLLDCPQPLSRLLPVVVHRHVWYSHLPRGLHLVYHRLRRRQ